MNTSLLMRVSPSFHGRPVPSALLLNCRSMCTPWNTCLSGEPLTARMPLVRNRSGPRSWWMGGHGGLLGDADVWSLSHSCSNLHEALAPNVLQLAVRLAVRQWLACHPWPQLATVHLRTSEHTATHHPIPLLAPTTTRDDMLVSTAHHEAHLDQLGQPVVELRHVALALHGDAHGRHAVVMLVGQVAAWMVR